MDRDWVRANGNEALIQLWAVRLETKGHNAESSVVKLSELCA